MFDINKIINDTIAAAVSTHITTLQQEYANKMGEMAEKITALETRLLALENNPAQGVDTTLEETLQRLDNQEWFWDKIRNFTDTAVEQAIEQHCEEYDHDDFVKNANFRDEIEDVLNNATIKLRF